MRVRPAAAMICRPLTEPSRHPNVARTQVATAINSKVKPDRASSRTGSPMTSPSSIPVVEMIEAAKTSPGGVFRKRKTACWRPRSASRPATPPST